MKFRPNYILIFLLMICITYLLYKISTTSLENYTDIRQKMADAKKMAPTFGSGSAIAETPETETSHYNKNNYNIEYHDSVDTIAKQNDLYDANAGIAWVIDPTGKKVAMPKLYADSSTTYYKPGTYKYGAGNYVPSYEDSIYLSKNYRDVNASDFIYPRRFYETNNISV